jgi:hypothetical protein
MVRLRRCRGDPGEPAALLTEPGESCGVAQAIEVKIAALPQ